MEKEINFGKHLRKLREAKGMMQRELADALDIKQNTLSSYENGKRYPEMFTLLKIANYFDVSLDDLVYKIDVEANQEELTEDEKHLLLEIEAGKSAEELLEQYDFKYDGELLDDEGKKRVLDQIYLEHLRIENLKSK